MTKGLEALGRITGTQNLTMYEQDQCLKTIEKELKALEIIKKFVNIDMLMFKGEIEQEEYDLLKEILL